VKLYGGIGGINLAYHWHNGSKPVSRKKWRENGCRLMAIWRKRREMAKLNVGGGNVAKSQISSVAKIKHQ